MAGVVIALGTAAAAQGPIEARASLSVEARVGVVGDRYARDAGTWQEYPDQHVTLVEEADALDVGIAPLELRRNVVTRGVSLLDLVGRTFRIGDVILHGMRPCLPCGHLERSLGRPGLKESLRGGLRARVVRGGTLRVGETIETVPTLLDDDMRAVVESAHLAFVATVTAEGRPNLSPKGTIRVLDERRLFFLDIASPQTRRNLEKNPWMEVNVVDTTSRRGYRFFGKATIHRGDDPQHAASAARVFAEDGATYDARATVVLEVERALPLVSPGYANVPDEREMRAAWVKRRAALDAAFEEHLARRTSRAGDSGVGDG